MARSKNGHHLTAAERWERKRDRQGRPGIRRSANRRDVVRLALAEG